MTTTTAEAFALQTRVAVTLPDWVVDFVPWDTPLGSDEARVRLAIALARENVLRDTGGPFGAVVTEHDTGRIVGVGVNRVIPLANGCLHAEVVAFMMAHAARRAFTLSAPGLAVHDLASSCDPCAMCLGATLWSGVRRVVTGASRDDAVRIGFDEGPVFPESFRYLESRGITFRRGVLRDDARAVLELYVERGGRVYNG